MFRPGQLAVEHLDEFGEMRDQADGAERCDACLDRAVDGDDHVALAEHADHRRHAGHGAQRTVQPEFADEREALELFGGDQSAGRENADDDCQIQARARLALIRRGEVDRDPDVRVVQTAAEDRGANPVARLRAPTRRAGR